VPKAGYPKGVFNGIQCEGVSDPLSGSMIFQKERRSLNWQLTKIVLGIFVPAICFAGILLWQFSRSERSRVE
jgi:hypothetical protein